MSDKLNILLIEDNPDHADLIRLHLTRGRDKAVAVEWVDRLGKGMDRATRGGIDAILLDMMLPDSSGMETVIKAHTTVPNIPLVVLTSADGDEYGLEAMHHGAEDYVFKGRMDGQNLIRSIRYAMERSGRKHAETALEGARQELRIAQQIQQSLYPLAAPPAAGLEIAGASHPAESVGGDYFDYFPMLDNQLGIAVGDVSGHGIGPALLMAEARAALRTLAHTYRDAGEVLTLANRILLDGMMENRFITLILAGLNLTDRTLTYASAGHPDGLIFDADGGLVATLPSTWFPLGIVADGDVPVSGPITLTPGHTILMCTDGIIEASPPHTKNPFGVDRISQIMREHRALPAATIIDKLRSHVLAHCNPGKVIDDFTAVVIKVLK